MLNISLFRVTEQLQPQRFSAMRRVEALHSGRVLLRLLVISAVVFIVFMFLPWTQNIRAPGDVTTFLPDQRPQAVQSVIAGQIEDWYVQEGDFVSAGDTILFLSEVKSDYLDPELVERTDQQLRAKEFSTQAYREKASALEARIVALRENAELKIEQARNKLQQAKLKAASDSIDLQAAITRERIANEQFERIEELYEDGLKSLTELENRQAKQQDALAKRISAENKFLNSKNDIINARVEINAIRTKLRDDVAKAQSDRLSALSSVYDTEATVSKLENQKSNYQARNAFYYVTAPQDGYVTEVIRAGIGENVKDGERILTIMPADYQLAVELYIEPIDLPLVRKGQIVNIQFEGWPAIVFSGWPNTSYGTFQGTVYAIDNFVSANGKYRILARETKDAEPWPDALRVGAGADNLILLEDVPVWYEIWRKLNAFPPDLPDDGAAKKNVKK